MGVNAIIETGCKRTQKIFCLQYPKRVILFFNIRQLENALEIFMNAYRTIVYRNIFVLVLFTAIFFSYCFWLMYTGGKFIYSAF
jgi:hypothetical protein